MSPILITMGDACGIGPEIIAKAFAGGEAPHCVVVGHVGVLRRAVRWVGSRAALAQIDTLADAHALPPRVMPVQQPEGVAVDLHELPIGRIDARAGRAAAACIEYAVARVRTGDAAAIVTAPIHKEALHAAGIAFPGHTEMLQSLASDHGSMPPVRMMLASPELRVVLVTIHLSLRDAIEQVTFDNVLATIRIAATAATRWGLARPRIAVAGLNPHAGEGGLFGDEEIRHIAPAIAAARGDGIDASGPYAPDTVFMRARHAAGHPGEFDIVIAMTHDHGLIPVKYPGVEHGVNVTLGLPFVRTSPDHGTAFEIAGTGRADPRSLVAAIRMARELAAPRDAARAALSGATTP
jgi:4-hydroxythreonine-4-phosphate dehydrogenase